MRKIHITESQLKELKKKINEAYTVDATQELEQNGGNAKKAADTLFAKNPTLKSDADKGEANVGFNPTALEEDCCEDNACSMKGKSYTKKQIKEAKLRKLKENCTIIKKKDIK